MISAEISEPLLDVWAKPSEGPGRPGLSLLQHTVDVLIQMGRFIRLYWRELTSVRDVDLARVLLYGALLHDLGKAHKGFQVRVRGGQSFGLRHEILSLAFAAFLEVPPTEFPYLVAAVALHHKDWRTLTEGSSRSPLYFAPSSPTIVPAALSELAEGLEPEKKRALAHLVADAGCVIRELTGIDVVPYPLSQVALGVARTPAVSPATGSILMVEAIHQALLQLYQLLQASERPGGRGRPAQIDHRFVHVGILTRGLMLSSDHLASASPSPPIEGFQRVDDVLTALQRKPDGLWPHQRTLSEALGNQILVAPTGAGKTEAALLWAAYQRQQEGTKGRLYFLLPYRASMNAMADRLARDLGKGSVSLVHGKSLIKVYEDLLDRGYDPEDAVRVARQQEALARLNTAPIRVCSPYQIIRPFFGQKGYEANLCAVLGAQLVVDEIHAYEPQITAMTLAAIRFLVERFGAKALFMSATLPSHLLEVLRQVFLGLPDPVRPSNDWLEGLVRHRVKLVQCSALSQEAVQAIVAASRQGSVLVVVNQVKRAIKLITALRANQAEDVVLLHSRFTARDRADKERMLKPRKGRILVATQAVEVSLDIDYDFGFSELAPLEALLQRFGRVNRHGGRPPAVICVFESFDENGDNAFLPYDRDHLAQVLSVLRKHGQDRPDGTWSELDTQTYLDESYPSDLKALLSQELQRRSEEFDRYFVKELRPFGARNADDLKRLSVEWEQLFDGFEVLPESLLPEARQAHSSLDVVQLLVPISGKQFRRLTRLCFDKELREHVVRCRYDSELGLQLE